MQRKVPRGQKTGTPKNVPLPWGAIGGACLLAVFAIGAGAWALARHYAKEKGPAVHEIPAPEIEFVR